MGRNRNQRRLANTTATRRDDDHRRRVTTPSPGVRNPCQGQTARGNACPWSGVGRRRGLIARHRGHLWKLKAVENVINPAKVDVIERLGFRKGDLVADGGTRGLSPFRHPRGFQCPRRPRRTIDIVPRAGGIAKIPIAQNAIQARLGGA